MNSGGKQLLGSCRECPAPMQRPPAGGQTPGLHLAVPRQQRHMCHSLQNPAGAFHPGWDGGPGCCWGPRGGGKDCYPTGSPIPSGTRTESTHEHPAGPFQAGFVQEGVERGRTCLRDPRRQKTAPGAVAGAAVPGHPGVGWVPATPTWHTGIVGQAGDAPKRHLNLGHVLGCNPPKASSRAGEHEELGGAGGSQEALSHQAMPLPSCLDGTVMDTLHAAHHGSPPLWGWSKVQVAPVTPYIPEATIPLPRVHCCHQGTTGTRSCVTAAQTPPWGVLQWKQPSGSMAGARHSHCQCPRDRFPQQGQCQLLQSRVSRLCRHCCHRHHHHHPGSTPRQG